MALRQGRTALVFVLLVLPLAACTKPADKVLPQGGGHNHLRAYFESQGIALPARYYEEVDAALAEEERRYDGRYVPACWDTHNNVVRLEGASAPAPGQLLTVAAGDPAIKDRSLARIVDNWADYFKEEFQYNCTLEGVKGQLCDPATYYSEYEDWRKGDHQTPPPQPHPFIFIPPHVAIKEEPGRNPQKEIFDLLERIQHIPERKERLLALHLLCSWLKGAPIAPAGEPQRIAGVDVRPLTSVHFTGQGTSWGVALIFPPPDGAGSQASPSPTLSPSPSPSSSSPSPPALPEPQTAVAIVNLLKKTMSTNPDYSAIYTARFAPGQPLEEYRAFAASYPAAVFYENLAYAGDPLAPAPGPAGKEGSVLRTLLFPAIVSAVQDEKGRPVLNGLPQRPPSGKCEEEASYFFHPAMVHPADGWAMPIWSYGRRDAISAASPQATPSPQQPGGVLHDDPGLMVDVLKAYPAVAAEWNKNYRRVEPKVTSPLFGFISHVEFYDSHLYIPHGRVDFVRARLSDLMTKPHETKEDWAALGYKVPADWPCTKEQPCTENPCAKLVRCTEDNLGIKAVDDKCRADAACVRSVADVFKAPYDAALSRVASSLAAEHDDKPDAPTDDYNSFGEVRKMFQDPIVESVVDRVACRRDINTVVVADAQCRYQTPVPDTPYGKSGLVGEPVLFLWNYLWTYGSMYPLHVQQGALPASKGLHLPRYWSLADYQDGRLNVDAGGELAGLLSFRHFDAGQVSFPAGADYGADWFVHDVHGYFNDGEHDKLPEILKAGGGREIDLRKINRAGRGDVMYLLQYFPQRFLYWNELRPNVPFDERYGSNLPAPSYPRLDGERRPR
ncbi:MAG TPA: hypothetical protein VF546_05935 [Pyrinomonadaceae bacterium]|jgi:hypothetical protein